MTVTTKSFVHVWIFGLTISLVLLMLAGCQSKSPATASPVSYNKDSLPPPHHTKSVTRFSKVLGWPKQKRPVAPEGFKVTRFATGLQNPRWIYQAPNGDVFISEANTILSGIKKIGANLHPRIKTQGYGTSANRITLFRDSNKDGTFETKSIFLQNLNQPLGMLVLDSFFYVANTDGLIRFPYTTGATNIHTTGKKIVELPAGGYNNHWTRNIIANSSGSKIYISVGSGSNVGENGMEHEVRRAAILEVNPDGTGERIYASGLRNPVGMGWAPGTQTLWTAVNERDGLGDELVPDYLTGVKPGGFYGWPYAYFGKHEDPRWADKQQPEMVQKSIVPDLSLGAHTASLGLAFYNKTTFPAQYHNGAFIGQHGSWNRSSLAGYKVVFVPFKNGKPAGVPVDFLTGFIKDHAEREVYGRPAGVAVLQDGSLLVADDAAGVVWKVEAVGAKGRK